MSLCACVCELCAVLLDLRLRRPSWRRLPWLREAEDSSWEKRKREREEAEEKGEREAEERSERQLR